MILDTVSSGGPPAGPYGTQADLKKQYAPTHDVVVMRGIGPGSATISFFLTQKSE